MDDADAVFMGEALVEARAAAGVGDVPVGAVMVRDGRVIARGHNRKERDRDPTAHAEMEVLRRAARVLGGWRLPDCTLYVTLEPCVMCVGAMVNARISRVIYGARDEKAGALGSMYDIGRDGRLNHRFEVVGGVMQSECAEIMREFFRARRAGG